MLLYRLFKGYVVQQDYRYLTAEERERREDERHAAIQIQK